MALNDLEYMKDEPVATEQKGRFDSLLSGLQSASIGSPSEQISSSIGGEIKVPSYNNPEQAQAEKYAIRPDVVPAKEQESLQRSMDENLTSIDGNSGLLASMWSSVKSGAITQKAWEQIAEATRAGDSEGATAATDYLNKFSAEHQKLIKDGNPNAVETALIQTAETMPYMLKVGVAMGISHTVANQAGSAIARGLGEGAVSTAISQWYGKTASKFFATEAVEGGVKLVAEKGIKGIVGKALFRAAVRQVASDAVLTPLQLGAASTGVGAIPAAVAEVLQWTVNGAMMVYDIIAISRALSKNEQTGQMELKKMPFMVGRVGAGVSSIQKSMEGSIYADMITADPKVAKYLDPKTIGVAALSESAIESLYNPFSIPAPAFAMMGKGMGKLLVRGAIGQSITARRILEGAGGVAIRAIPEMQEEGGQAVSRKYFVSKELDRILKEHPEMAVAGAFSSQLTAMADTSAKDFTKTYVDNMVQAGPVCLIFGMMGLPGYAMSIHKNNLNSDEFSKASSSAKKQYSGLTAEQLDTGAQTIRELNKDNDGYSKWSTESLIKLREIGTQMESHPDSAVKQNGREIIKEIDKSITQGDLVQFFEKFKDTIPEQDKQAFILRDTEKTEAEKETTMPQVKFDYYFHEFNQYLEGNGRDKISTDQFKERVLGEGYAFAEAEKPVATASKGKELLNSFLSISVQHEKNAETPNRKKGSLLEAKQTLFNHYRELGLELAGTEDAKIEGAIKKFEKDTASATVAAEQAKLEEEGKANSAAERATLEEIVADIDPNLAPEVRIARTQDQYKAKTGKDVKIDYKTSKELFGVKWDGQNISADLINSVIAGDEADTTALKEAIAGRKVTLNEKTIAKLVKSEKGRAMLDSIFGDEIKGKGTNEVVTILSGKEELKKKREPTVKTPKTDGQVVTKTEGQREAIIQKTLEDLKTEDPALHEDVAPKVTALMEDGDYTAAEKELGIGAEEVVAPVVKESVKPKEGGSVTLPSDVPILAETYSSNNEYKIPDAILERDFGNTDAGKIELARRKAENKGYVKLPSSLGIYAEKNPNGEYKISDEVLQRDFADTTGGKIEIARRAEESSSTTPPVTPTVKPVENKTPVEIIKQTITEKKQSKTEPKLVAKGKLDADTIEAGMIEDGDKQTKNGPYTLQLTRLFAGRMAENGFKPVKVGENQFVFRQTEKKDASPIVGEQTTPIEEQAPATEKSFAEVIAEKSKTLGEGKAKEEVQQIVSSSLLKSVNRAAVQFKSQKSPKVAMAEKTLQKAEEAVREANTTVMPSKMVEDRLRAVEVAKKNLTVASEEAKKDGSRNINEAVSLTTGLSEETITEVYDLVGKATSSANTNIDTYGDGKGNSNVTTVNVNSSKKVQNRAYAATMYRADDGKTFAIAVPPNYMNEARTGFLLNVRAEWVALGKRQTFMDNSTALSVENGNMLIGLRLSFNGEGSKLPPFVVAVRREDGGEFYPTAAGQHTGNGKFLSYMGYIKDGMNLISLSSNDSQVAKDAVASLEKAQYQKIFDYREKEQVDALLGQLPSLDRAKVSSGDVSVLETDEVKEAIKALGYDDFYKGYKIVPKEGKAATKFNAIRSLRANAIKEPLMRFADWWTGGYDSRTKVDATAETAFQNAIYKLVAESRNSAHAEKLVNWIGTEAPSAELAKELSSRRTEAQTALDALLAEKKPDAEAIKKAEEVLKGRRDRYQSQVGFWYDLQREFLGRVTAEVGQLIPGTRERSMIAKIDGVMQSIGDTKRERIATELRGGLNALIATANVPNSLAGWDASKSVLSKADGYPFKSAKGAFSRARSEIKAFDSRFWTAEKVDGGYVLVPAGDVKNMGPMGAVIGQYFRQYAMGLVRFRDTVKENTDANTSILSRAMDRALEIFRSGVINEKEGAFALTDTEAGKKAAYSKLMASKAVQNLVRTESSRYRFAGDYHPIQILFDNETGKESGEKLKEKRYRVSETAAMWRLKEAAGVWEKMALSGAVGLEIDRKLANKEKGLAVARENDDTKQIAQIEKEIGMLKALEAEYGVTIPAKEMASTFIQSVKDEVAIERSTRELLSAIGSMIDMTSRSNTDKATGRATNIDMATPEYNEASLEDQYAEGAESRGKDKTAMGLVELGDNGELVYSEDKVAEFNDAFVPPASGDTVRPDEALISKQGQTDQEAEQEVAKAMDFLKNGNKKEQSAIPSGVKEPTSAGRELIGRIEQNRQAELASKAKIREIQYGVVSTPMTKEERVKESARIAELDREYRILEQQRREAVVLAPRPQNPNWAPNKEAQSVSRGEQALIDLVKKRKRYIKDNGISISDTAALQKVGELFPLSSLPAVYQEYLGDNQILSRDEFDRSMGMEFGRKGMTYQRTNEGFVASINGKPTLRVVYNPDALLENGKMMGEGKARAGITVTSATEMDVLYIARMGANAGTVSHELAEWAFQRLLNDSERTLVIGRYKSAHAWADAMQNWTSDPQDRRMTKVMNGVSNFFARMLGLRTRQADQFDRETRLLNDINKQYQTGGLTVRGEQKNDGISRTVPNQRDFAKMSRADLDAAFRERKRFLEDAGITVHTKENAERGSIESFMSKKNLLAYRATAEMMKTEAGRNIARIWENSFLSGNLSLDSKMSTLAQFDPTGVIAEVMSSLKTAQTEKVAPIKGKLLDIVKGIIPNNPESKTFSVKLGGRNLTLNYGELASIVAASQDHDVMASFAEGRGNRISFRRELKNEKNVSDLLVTQDELKALRGILPNEKQIIDAWSQFSKESANAVRNPLKEITSRRGNYLGAKASDIGNFDKDFWWAMSWQKEEASDSVDRTIPVGRQSWMMGRKEVKNNTLIISDIYSMASNHASSVANIAGKGIETQELWETLIGDKMAGKEGVDADVNEYAFTVENGWTSKQATAIKKGLYRSLSQEIDPMSQGDAIVRHPVFRYIKGGQDLYRLSNPATMLKMASSVHLMTSFLKDPANFGRAMMTPSSSVSEKYFRNNAYLWSRGEASTPAMVGESMAESQGKDVLTDKKSLLNDLRSLPAKADRWAMRKTFLAAAYDMLPSGMPRTIGSLNKMDGDIVFWGEVQKHANRIVLETQPSFESFMRGDFINRKTVLTTILTRYSTQQNRMFNILTSAFMEMKTNDSPQSRAKFEKIAMSVLGTNTFVMAMIGAGTVGTQALMKAAVRGQDEDDDDMLFPKEKKIDPKTGKVRPGMSAGAVVGGKFAQETANSIVGLLEGGSYALAILAGAKGMFDGETYKADRALQEPFLASDLKAAFGVFGSAGQMARAKEKMIKAEEEGTMSEYMTAKRTYASQASKLWADISQVIGVTFHLPTKLVMNTFAKEAIRKNAFGNPLEEYGSRYR